MKLTLSAKLEKVIGEGGRFLQRKTGQLSKPIKRRINQICAAANYLEYQGIGIGDPHLLSGDFRGCFAVTVSGNYRLIIRLCCDDLSPESLRECDEGIWEGVVDYHEHTNNWLIP